MRRQSLMVSWEEWGAESRVETPLGGQQTHRETTKTVIVPDDEDDGVVGHESHSQGSSTRRSESITRPDVERLTRQSAVRIRESLASPR